MLNKHKIMAVFLSLSIISMFTPVKVNAEIGGENVTNEMTFDFGDFSYTAEGISENEVYIEHNIEKDKNSYVVYDKETGMITDTITVETPAINTLAVNPTAHVAFFTHDYAVNGGSKKIVSVQFTACVLYYSSGSFRSFEGIRYTELGLKSPATPLELVNSKTDAWSSTGSFPCTKINYAFSTGLRTTGSISLDLSVLISAGFSTGSYCYLYMNRSGAFNLYN